MLAERVQRDLLAASAVAVSRAASCSTSHNDRPLGVSG